MKKNKFIVATFVVLVAITSCRKEKTSFSTFPANAEEPAPANKPVRNEILSGVFSFANISTPGKLLIHDYNGKLIREVVVPYAGTNLQRWDINNTFYYSYLEFDPTTYLMPGVGYIPGPIVLLDSGFNEIKRISLLPYKGRGAGAPDALDLHEFILLDENHYIAMAYYQTTVNNIPDFLNPHPNVKVVDNIIQEVKNGQVVYEWHSVDYPEFYSTSIQGNNFTDSVQAQDYLHINSIFIDPNDNNLIISARNTDQVFKISRYSGDVLWRLGGNNSNFPLTGEQKFLRQHHATITKDNTLILFDNGDNVLRPYSRIVEYNLDYISKTVNSFKSVNLPGNLFCSHMASVQKTDSSYFIGCGTQNRILEIDYNNLKVLLDIPLERPSYRSYRY